MLHTLFALVHALQTHTYLCLLHVKSSIVKWYCSYTIDVTQYGSVVVILTLKYQCHVIVKIIQILSIILVSIQH